MEHCIIHQEHKYFLRFQQSKGSSKTADLDSSLSQHYAMRVHGGGVCLHTCVSPLCKYYWLKAKCVNTFHTCKSTEKLSECEKTLICLFFSELKSSNIPGVTRKSRDFIWVDWKIKQKCYLCKREERKKIFCFVHPSHDATFKLRKSLSPSHVPLHFNLWYRP